MHATFRGQSFQRILLSQAMEVIHIYIHLLRRRKKHYFKIYEHFLEILLICDLKTNIPLLCYILIFTIAWSWDSSSCEV